MSHNIGKTGYYKDWSTFPDLVMSFIKDYRLTWEEDKSRVKLVPQYAIMDYIMEEYDCSWTHAHKKLKLLVSERQELEFVKKKQRGMWQKGNHYMYVQFTRRRRW